MPSQNRSTRRLLFSRLTLICALLGASGACSDTSNDATPDVGITQDATGEKDATPQQDADADADADSVAVDPYKRTEAQPGVAPQGAADVETPLEDGQARVGKISGEQTDFSGVWAQCRTGDFKLYNSKIIVCIQAESTNLFEFYSGAMIVDARRVDGPREDTLGQVLPMLGLGTTLTSRVEVIRDGSDGGAAVLRATATDVGIAHIYGLLGQSLGNPLRVNVVTEYRLEPDSDTVEIVSWYHNENTGARSFQAGDWFGYGDRGVVFVENQGEQAPQGEFSWLASLAPERSYGWVADAGSMASGLALGALDIPWIGAQGAQFRLAAGEEKALRRWFVVGDGTLADIRERAAALRGDSLAGQRRTLRVQTDAGEPVVGHWVRVFQGDTPLEQGLTDAQGDVVLHLEDAEYTLEIDGFAAGATFERSLSVEGPAQTVTVDTPGTLRLDISEAGVSTKPTVRVVVRGGSGWAGVALHGELELKLAPGSYQVAISHGSEYDALSFPVEIVAGEVAQQSQQIQRAFETDGWLSGDFHQHMEPSIDSTVRVDDRLLENAAAGVELVVSTDHEVISDLSPLLSKYGLEDVMRTFAGAEVSPIDTHVGMYPLERDVNKRGNGSIQLAYLDDEGNQSRRLIPEVLQIARALPSDPVLQLNHARNSSSGMFEQVGFDPELGPDAVDDARFSTDFDVIEIINRYDDTCELLADWSGLLNAGIRLTGLGNSDTHDLSGESGLPRNFLRIDKAPRDVTEEDLRAVLRAGQVTVGSHAFIDFSDGKLPGDLIEVVPGEAVEFNVRVRTPAWAQADHLFALVNGEVVAVRERAASAGEYVDFDEAISLTFSQDSWVVFFSFGQRPSAPFTTSKRVIAFTNPIFVDTDANARFDAPGPRPLALSAIDPLCD